MVFGLGSQAVLALARLSAPNQSINLEEESSRPRGIAGLGIREWTCDDCGTAHDRDVNAAKNILRCGLTALAEGALTSKLGSPAFRPRSSHVRVTGAKERQRDVDGVLLLKLIPPL
jgi:putative transposase-like DNA-binding protein